MIRRRVDINLEVTFDPIRGKWVVRHFGGDRVWAVERTRSRAESTAAVLAWFIAVNFNRPKRGRRVGTCEVHVRELDGSFGDPSTYGVDPEASRG